MDATSTLDVHDRMTAMNAIETRTERSDLRSAASSSAGGFGANRSLCACGLTRGQVIASWVMQIIAALILFQTLFFKFTAAEESVYIFRTLGMEPWGRMASGFAELIACILLLIPVTIPVGALLSLGVISGAIMSHLTKLGVVVKDDGGLLFALALVVFACSAAVLVLRRAQAIELSRRLLGRRKVTETGI